MIENVDRRADAVPDALQQRGVMLGHAAVAAQHLAVGVGADDGDRLDLVRIQRSQAAVVLEQRDRLARRLEGQLAMGFAADDPLGDRRVHVGVLEQPQPELPGQHRRHELVEERLLQHTLADEIDEMRVAIGIRQFDVDARLAPRAAAAWRPSSAR